MRQILFHILFSFYVINMMAGNLSCHRDTLQGTQSGCVSIDWSSVRDDTSQPVCHGAIEKRLNLEEAIRIPATDNERHNPDSTFNFNNHDEFLSKAVRRINCGKPVLYELGGIVPVYVSGQYGFDAFQIRFNVSIEIVGCEFETDEQTYRDCNFLVFDWLEDTYGNVWRSGDWRNMFDFIEGFDIWENKQILSHMTQSQK